MTRVLNKLTARTVATLTEPGRYSDGGGLVLLVDGTGAKRWLFIYRWQGRRPEMGLGSTRDVSLAQAREKAAAARALLAQGRNPLEEKAKAGNATTVPTFAEVADAFIAAREPSWRSTKHARQWEMTLTRYCAAIRDTPVDQVTTADVLSVLTPLWNTRPETGSRLRGRVEAILDASRAAGHIAGPWNNPAAWRGHLAHILPKPRKLVRGHHAALPYADVPDFLAELRQRRSTAAKALEFTILTAARTGEALGMTWGEIDWDRTLWIVPKSRMKSGRQHTVPLSGPALAVLREMQGIRGENSEFVFPGLRCGKPLSNMGMEMLLRRMGRDSITVHGFRSSFRDWAAECTSTPNHVAEMALAHVVASATERAYRRGDLLEQRRALMQAWAAFVEGDRDTVVPFSVRSRGGSPPP